MEPTTSKDLDARGPDVTSLATSLARAAARAGLHDAVSDDGRTLTATFGGAAFLGLTLVSKFEARWTVNVDGSVLRGRGVFAESGLGLALHGLVGLLRETAAVATPERRAILDEALVAVRAAQTGLHANDPKE